MLSLQKSFMLPEYYFKYIYRALCFRNRYCEISQIQVTFQSTDSKLNMEISFSKTPQNIATLTSLALDTESEGGDLAGLSDLVLIRSYN